MPSTYTTSLKIQQIGNGEQSGVWGNTTNSNWNLIEQAVAGVQTITMANADYTLTNLNGVPDEARNTVLVVQGINSGVRKIIAPLNQPKTYIISNQTTGGYDITIGSSTGDYITIPNGVTAQVYTDGTNFYSSQTGSAGDFYVNGNATVEGNLTVSGITNIIPTGVIQMWPTVTAPTGFLLCTGTAVSRTTYAALFAVIGTTFGAGDGSTTFNLPDMRSLHPKGAGGVIGLGVIAGSSVVTLNTGNLPAHNHGINDPGHVHSITDPGHTHPQRQNISPSFQGGAAGANVSYGSVSSNSTTRVSTDSNTTGISVQSHTTGITTQNTGTGDTFSTAQPSIGVNYIVYTGVGA